MAEPPHRIAIGIGARVPEVPPAALTQDPAPLPQVAVPGLFTTARKQRLGRRRPEGDEFAGHVGSLTAGRDGDEHKQAGDRDAREHAAMIRSGDSRRSRG
jgi:hypothetical protein